MPPGLGQAIRAGLLLAAGQHSANELFPRQKHRARLLKLAIPPRKAIQERLVLLRLLKANRRNPLLDSPNLRLDRGEHLFQLCHNQNSVEAERRLLIMVTIMPSSVVSWTRDCRLPLQAGQVSCACEHQPPRQSWWNTCPHCSIYTS
jgi:hypothetical protein